MSPSLPWPPEPLAPAVVCLVAAAAYVLLHYHLSAPAWARRWRLEPGAPRAVFAQRLSGGLVLGSAALVGLAFAPSPARSGLLPVDPLRSLLVALGTLALALPFVVLGSRKPAFAVDYPQVRVASWDGALRRANAGRWAVYLVGYEALFRGSLLFVLAEAHGPTTAVAVNALAYAWAHLAKPASETWATIPMGVVFSVGALWSGSFWGAWLAHSLIAITSDGLAARAGARAGEA